MKPMHIAMALLSAAMFFVLAGVFMGVQLELDGTKLVVDTASDIRWQWVFIGTAVVFFFQLLRPAFQKGLKSVSGPKFILPAIDGSTVKQKLFLVALLVLAVAWPFMVSRGTVDIATLTMIYIILGLGLNVVVGLSGLLVLGYGGFYAIGAYTFALLNHYYGLGFWTCLPIAGLMAAAAGFLLGFPVLRLRGDYLAIVTLGFGEIVRILLLNNTEITGGPNGISQIPKPTFFGLEFSRTAREGGWDTFSNFFGLKYDPSDRVIFLYLVALLLVVLSLFVINRLLRMPLGRAWEALREDEIACRSLGLSPRRIKLTAFTISAAFAGFAGTLFAARQGFVSPESFTFAESAFVLAIGRALMSNPRLLLLDEPSLGLAPIIIQQIFDTIEQLREQGMTIFLVEQNANQALKLADRGYVLENGHVVLSDTGDALLANEAVRSAYLGG